MKLRSFVPLLVAVAAFVALREIASSRDHWHLKFEEESAARQNAEREIAATLEAQEAELAAMRARAAELESKLAVATTAAVPETCPSLHPEVAAREVRIRELEAKLAALSGTSGESLSAQGIQALRNTDVILATWKVNLAINENINGTIEFAEYAEVPPTVVVNPLYPPGDGRQVLPPQPGDLAPLPQGDAYVPPPDPAAPAPEEPKYEFKSW